MNRCKGYLSFTVVVDQKPMITWIKDLLLETILFLASLSDCVVNDWKRIWIVCCYFVKPSTIDIKAQYFIVFSIEFYRRWLDRLRRQDHPLLLTWLRMLYYSLIPFLYLLSVWFWLNLFSLFSQLECGVLASVCVVEICFSAYVVRIAMKSTNLSRFVSPTNYEIISRYYRQNCKNSRLFSRNPTFAGEPLGHHQKDTYEQIDHQVMFYYQYLSLIYPLKKTLKNWKYRHLVWKFKRNWSFRRKTSIILRILKGVLWIPTGQKQSSSKSG